MSADDRKRWDLKYLDRGPEDEVLPEVFEPYVAEFPTRGDALEVACGRGQTSVWLARRGLNVVGVDASGVAIAHARDLALRTGVSAQCRFGTHDLDFGLPVGPPVNLIVCNKFRDRRLDRQLISRLAPEGLLAICVLSEVGAQPGPFRAVRGELVGAFADLRLVAAGEGHGQAWLLARAEKR